MRPKAKSRDGRFSLGTAIHAKAKFRCPEKGKIQMSAKCQERKLKIRTKKEVRRNFFEENPLSMSSEEKNSAYFGQYILRIPIFICMDILT